MGFNFRKRLYISFAATSVAAYLLIDNPGIFTFKVLAAQFIVSLCLEELRKVLKDLNVKEIIRDYFLNMDYS
jgi:hypothetical protein